MQKIAAILMMAFLATSVSAHSKVDTTLPENGARLAEAPQAVTLRFIKKIRLIKVDVTHAEGPGTKLDLVGQTAFSTEFIIPMTALGDGEYVVHWRGLGVDGHAMSGEFMFVVE